MVVEHPTINLAGFGLREVGMAAELLHAFAERKISTMAAAYLDHSGDISVGFNPQSTSVYLYDENYTTCVMESGKLVYFVSCGECGNEGTETEFAPDQSCEGCQECADRIKEYQK